MNPQSMAIDLASEQHFIAISKVSFYFFLFDGLENTKLSGLKESSQKKYLMREEESTWLVFVE